MVTSAVSVILIAVVIAVVIFTCYRYRLLSPVNSTLEESYQPGDYYQMSHLPWATPPTGIGALGMKQDQALNDIYPQRSFPTGKVPVSCPPDGVRIYETGNAFNPNVYSAYGVIQPDEIRY